MKFYKIITVVAYICGFINFCIFIYCFYMMGYIQAQLDMITSNLARI